MIVLLSRWMCLLPMSWALLLGRFVGWLWYWVIPIRRGVAMQNIERALGNELSQRERRRAVRRAFTLWALYAIDTLRAPKMTPELSDSLVERHGFERLDAALEAGTGCICILIHTGSLDMAGFTQAVRGLPVSAVVREVSWGPAQRFMQLVRDTTRLRVIPHRRSREQCLEVLRNNGILVLVIDQHMAPHRAIVSELFGMLASTTPAPIQFALETGAPIFPSYITRVGLTEKHVCRIEPAFELESPSDDATANLHHNVRRMNEVVERWVRENPHDWLWMHRRWKVEDDPSGWEIPDALSRR